MKKSNYIAEKVFSTNLKYSRLQNETKELFFKCLDEGRDYEYFKEKLEKLWEGVDYSYYEKDLIEYQNMVSEDNLKGQEVEKKDKKNYTKYLALVPIAVALAQKNKFVNYKEKEYTISLNSFAYKEDKQEYLKNKVSKYTNQIVPYYSKSTNKVVRYVQLSTYESMIHNTNLTRTGWNTTLNDADGLGINYFIIPYHSFSCPYCLEHQGRPLSRFEVMNFIGIEAEEQEGDILHPNCKCELTFYLGGGYKMPKYSNSELEEQYQVRQKVNTLTLKKEEIATDIRIQKRLGNEDEVDKLNQQRNKINSQIRKEKEKLPTEELRKQVVAIIR